MYIQETDFLNFIAKDDFDAALAEGFTDMEALTRTACSTIRGYLYQRYRIAAEFKKTGVDRNEHLVMGACDIALYLLFSSLPGRLTEEDIRYIRYQAAIRWLEQCATGRIGAGIPSLSDPDVAGTDPEQNPEYYTSIRFESAPKLINEY